MFVLFVVVAVVFCLCLLFVYLVGFISIFVWGAGSLICCFPVGMLFCLSGMAAVVFCWFKQVLLFVCLCWCLFVCLFVFLLSSGADCLACVPYLCVYLFCLFVCVLHVALVV